MHLPEPTRDDVIAATEPRAGEAHAEAVRQELDALLEKTRLAERERCAKIADDMSRNFQWGSAEGAVLQELARRIRSGK